MNIIWKRVFLIIEDLRSKFTTQRMGHLSIVFTLKIRSRF